jgi:hypothetical protein
VVFLANVPELTASQLEQLQAFVEGGGSLVVSFGDRVRLPAFSSHLEALGLGRVGEKVQVRSRQPGDAVIGEVDLRHPVFEAFAASGTSAILRPRFRQYVAVEPDTNAVVIGRYDTGEPFLVERRLGQGRVLVYTSTFNTAWTDFPINEMYVPFLYQLAQHATREDGQRYQYTVGEPVPIRGAAGEEWEVRAPDGSLYRVALDAFGTGFFRETEAPGNYAAARGADQYFFSVNVDPRESVLASRDQEEAYAAVVGTAPGAEPAAAAQQAALTPEEEEGRQKLWRYLLLAVLVLFAFETYYANRRTAVRRV